MDKNLQILISKAKNGDKQALDIFLKKIQPTIYSMLFYLNRAKDDVADIAQNVLFKVSKNISKLKNVQSFKSWLNQIIINTYFDFVKQNKKHKETCRLESIADDVQFEVPDYKSNPQNSILNNELDFVIKTSINNLPTRYKIPIALREIQGLTYNEISNITKTTVGTIKSRIARARAMIKEDIDRYSKN